MGLVWSGYMDKMWNDDGQRVRPLTLFSRICTCVVYIILGFSALNCILTFSLHV